MKCRLKTIWYLAVWLGVMPGVLSLQAALGVEIPLQATAAAPLGAGGVARFENANGGATLAATLDQLGAGSYALSAVRRADGSVVSLGTVVITDPTAEPDPDASENRKERNTVNQAEDLRVQTKLRLPPGLPPGDIAEVRVSSSSGVVLLSGKVGPSVRPRTNVTEAHTPRATERIGGY